MSQFMSKRIKNKKTVTWYAMYRGDTFVDLGTADYLAEKYHKRKESLVYLSRPTVHRRVKKGGKRLLLYRIEED
ncbi:hypothetical protein LJ16_07530 [Lactobacillus johnsonii 16]|uniref:Uncharacterized protein n=2 Tax=Lactobacillaceae TaxID=33958 RepID=A0A256L8Z2_9LACO|nr:hypothetical protein [Lactobacillus johnsonii]KOH01683.1 hypothetical protein LJ16_07530 [Lactobacillus johnsonii 16]OYR86889.1 hypothetical protein CBF53_10590 [Lactobacillus taiwanensis]OYR89874.1 hypothetical protein CBF70_10900 [Lactobacillus taiwanensis]OYR91942.1 hypothetical protein CBF59_04855 [Lactobacillus taiwanensis]OYR93779.1 hypothetical protein CBF58_11175 [Lactobacillus taiwanensis]